MKLHVMHWALNVTVYLETFNYSTVKGSVIIQIITDIQNITFVKDIDDECHQDCQEVVKSFTVNVPKVTI